MADVDDGIRDDADNAKDKAQGVEGAAKDKVSDMRDGVEKRKDDLGNELTDASDDW